MIMTKDQWDKLKPGQIVLRRWLGGEKACLARIDKITKDPFYEQRTLQVTPLLVFTPGPPRYRGRIALERWVWSPMLGRRNTHLFELITSNEQA